MAHSFYLSYKISGNTAVIQDAESLHHLRDVLRLKPGDDVSLFDSEGNKYAGLIVSQDQKQAVVNITGCREALLRKHKIIFACAIPKKSLMDEIVDRLTQLGVDAIIPLETERVIVKLEENRLSRLARWKKIARSAAEQSQRNSLPEIPGILSFKEVLALAGDADLKLIPTLSGVRVTLRNALNGPEFKDVLVLIGPEGDFTDSELDQALAAGFVPVSLGDSVLRSETASMAVASYLLFTITE
jgi:16S rRNA (uracil1498-N3)-methyltransferase